MKIKKKIIKIGDSLGIILDKVVIETLELKEGDIVECNVKFVNIN